MPDRVPDPVPFQSHAGSIEASFKLPSQIFDKNGFNPTLVRLRPPSVDEVHKRLRKCFNPTLVRLRHDTRSRRDRTGIFSFNPTLVRLRPSPTSGSEQSKPSFQSHAGSIEARTRSRSRWVGTRFQSHAGSIEARGHCIGYDCGSWVSIPRWFD